MFIVYQNIQVHGFGPLNWLAGRKVSDLVQETLLQVKSFCLRRFVIFFIIPVIVAFVLENDLLAQEVELELRQGLEDQLDQLSIYFQVMAIWIFLNMLSSHNQIFPLQAVESESPGLVPIGLLVH